MVKQWPLKGYGIMLRSEWDVAQEPPDADIVALLGSEQRRRSARTMRFLELLKASLGARPWRPPA